MPNETTAARPPAGLKTAGIVAAVIAAIVVVVGLVARQRSATEAADWSAARSIPTVHLVPVEAVAATSALTLPGTLEAWNAAKLYARVGGYLHAWYHDIGSGVGAGTALGRIDTPEIDQQIVQARAAVARSRADAGLAKTTAARWNGLLATNSVSRQEADEKNGALAERNAAVAAAEADLGRLTAMKAFAVIRAPFAGVVTTRTADIGDLVGPGAVNPQPLFSVADIHQLRIYVNVPQIYSAAVRPGLTATLSLPDYPGRALPARVVATSGAINPQTGTFQVQLVTGNRDGALKAGGYAQVRFDVPGQAGSVTISSTTLVFRAAGTEVATVGADGRVRLLHVALGRDLGGTVEVTAGLRPGMTIVDNPPDSIADGELVRVARADLG